MEDSADLNNAIDHFVVELEALRTRLLGWGEALGHNPDGGLQMPLEQRRRLVAALEDLVVKRVLIQPAFTLLARLDLERSKALLLRRYVGQGVSADRKFGGYQFELSTLLTELVDIGGTKSLADLILEGSFDEHKLTDPRVLESICDALSLDSVELVHAWLKTVRGKG
jgi:hypothetical protein